MHAYEFSYYLLHMLMYLLKMKLGNSIYLINFKYMLASDQQLNIPSPLLKKRQLKREPRTICTQVKNWNRSKQKLESRTLQIPLYEQIA
jgi:hypothetical protein